MNRRHLLLCALTLVAMTLPLNLAFADEPKPASHGPRVLIIGDSISMGYTPFVKEMMKGKAYIEHPKDNCQATVVGLEKLDKWLGSEKWEVIHFNFGLHDLKYIKDTKGTIDGTASGRQWVPVDQYEKNLEQIVSRLEKTGAKLIWANTTPVPAGSTGRVQGDEIKYNEAAARVMTAHHIPTDDLHAIVVAHPDLQLPKNVHFTKAGYQALAESVVKHANGALVHRDE